MIAWLARPSLSDLERGRFSRHREGSGVERQALKRVPPTATQKEPTHARQVSRPTESRRRGALRQARRDQTSELKDASRQMYESMNEDQLDDFAATKRKGKPGRVGSPRDR